jgi:hypothetical protein
MEGDSVSHVLGGSVPWHKVLAGADLSRNIRSELGPEWAWNPAVGQWARQYASGAVVVISKGFMGWQFTIADAQGFCQLRPSANYPTLTATVEAAESRLRELGQLT